MIIVLPIQRNAFLLRLLIKYILCLKKIFLTYNLTFYLNKDENVHRFAIRGNFWRERERDRDKERQRV